MNLRNIGGSTGAFYVIGGCASIAWIEELLRALRWRGIVLSSPLPNWLLMAAFYLGVASIALSIYLLIRTGLVVGGRFSIGLAFVVAYGLSPLLVLYVRPVLIGFP